MNGRPSADKNPDPESETANELDALRAEIKRRGGMVGTATDPDTERDFLRHVLDWETSPHRTHRVWLAEKGITFEPPGPWDPDHLRSELNRLIEALAKARVFLHCTDHLSDEELYRRLWTETLEGKAPDCGRRERCCIHSDFADPSQSPEEERIWLTYYATDDERIEWKQMFPDVVLPTKLPLPDWP